ncbi:MAG: YkvA family protein [Herbinix sp.]|nr:YkvA family protein [Herbinix sp.]
MKAIKDNLKQRAKKLKLDIPAVFLALKIKSTPWYAKAIATMTIVYALSPIDLIPDFIPVLGYLDDIILLPALVALTIKLIPDSVFEECRRDADGLWREGKPKRWYYAVPIILLWIVIIIVFMQIINK